MIIENSKSRRKSNKLQKIFANNVIKHRKRLGISQEELAEICGYHRTYIGSVERAERNVTLATIESFATAFNVPPQELLITKDE